MSNPPCSGLASLAAGWAYTGGPAPIAYRPLGEVFVFIFFGLVAVSGSYYLQTLRLTPIALFTAALVGIHAAAVITVNNYRDLDGDARRAKQQRDFVRAAAELGFTFRRVGNV